MPFQHHTQVPTRTGWCPRRWAGWLSVIWAFCWIGIASADDRIPVALAYFENTSKDPEFEALKKGMAEMLITDLSISKEIRLVERGRLNEVLKEIDLQKSDFIDDSSAVVLGKGLGAEYIVTGSYLVQSEFMRVDARMLDVENGEIVFAVKSEGNTRDWFSIERTLATQLLEGLGATLTPIEKKKIGSSGTRNFDALTSYSIGLDALDSGDTDAASAALAQAITADPEFAAAQDLRMQINAMAASIESTLSDRKLEEIYGFLAGRDCACSYARPLEELETASLGSRLAYRFLAADDTTAQAGPNVFQSMNPMVLKLAQIGQFEEAQSITDAILSEDYGSAEGTIVTAVPNQPPFRGQIPSGSSMKAYRDCHTYQLRSYIHLLQLDFEEAMNWQLEAADHVAPSFEWCLTEQALLTIGITLDRPLRSEIQSAIDDPATFARWKQNRDEILTHGPKAWTQIQERLQQPVVCDEICPAAVIKVRDYEQEAKRKAEADARQEEQDAAEFAEREATRLVQFIEEHTTETTGLPEACIKSIGCCNWTRNTTQNFPYTCPSFADFQVYKDNPHLPPTQLHTTCDQSWKSTTALGDVYSVEWPEQCNYDVYITHKTEKEAREKETLQTDAAERTRVSLEQHVADGWPRICAQALACTSWMTDGLPETHHYAGLSDQYAVEFNKIRDKPRQLEISCNGVVVFVQAMSQQLALPAECE